MEKARVRAHALLKNTREELGKCRDGSKDEFEKAKQRGLERTAEAFGPALPPLRTSVVVGLPPPVRT
eukprot:1029369-Amphidinium_carterae.3